MGQHYVFRKHLKPIFEFQPLKRSLDRNPHAFWVAGLASFRLGNFEDAEKELPNIDEDADENRDTVSIFNLLKENLDMWTSEEEDK